MFSVLAIFASLILLISGQAPCPFNEEECMCTDPTSSPRDGLVYWFVECKSKEGQLPKFQALPDKKYSIIYELQITNADVRAIPAGHFGAFDLIGRLSLYHKPAGEEESRVIQWDDKAFDGVHFKHLITDGLDGLIPAPAALKDVNVQIVEFTNGLLPISLQAASLKNLPNIWDFMCENFTITEISADVFSGLDDQLTYVRLRGAKLSNSHLPSLKAALKNMKKLLLIDVTNNLITDVKRDTFPDLPLWWLILTRNPISNVPTDAFAGIKGLWFLNLDMIDTITSFDLATISNIDTDSLLIDFYYDSALKKLVVSEIGQFPEKSTNIDIAYSGLETMDSKVKDIIDQFPYVYIHMEQSLHLKCEGLEWMSKIECPDRIEIHGSKCADKQDQKLSDYLKSVDPDSKCTDSMGSGNVLRKIGLAPKPNRDGRNMHPTIPAVKVRPTI